MHRFRFCFCSTVTLLNVKSKIQKRLCFVSPRALLTLMPHRTWYTLFSFHSAYCRAPAIFVSLYALSPLQLCRSSMHCPYDMAKGVDAMTAFREQKQLILCTIMRVYCGQIHFTCHSDYSALLHASAIEQPLVQR